MKTELEKKLEELIIKDNFAWKGRTGEDYTKEIEKCRYEIKEVGE